MQKAPDEEGIYDPLTPRESEVLYWVGKGLSNPEIANKMSISIATVRTYVNILYDKLHLEGQFVRGKLVRYATELETLSQKGGSRLYGGVASDALDGL